MTNSGAHQIQIIDCLIVFPQVLRLELSLSVNPFYFSRALSVLHTTPLASRTCRRPTRSPSTKMLRVEIPSQMRHPSGFSATRKTEMLSFPSR